MFIFGFFIGILTTLFAIFIFLYTLKVKQEKIIKTSDNIKLNINNEEILNIIKEKSDNIIFNNNPTFKNNILNIKSNLVDLMESIAKIYYPTSKFPLYEFTFEEILQLNIHISQRVLKQLERKRFKVFKNIRISQIIMLNQLKNNTLEHKYIQKIKEMKIASIFSTAYMLLRSSDPKYWAMRVIKDLGINIAIRYIGSNIIKISGDELNKAYSKNFYTFIDKNH
ncbi:hypothetical protein [uncultured Cetobacterium sp.]|uniref:hypothetical protein n=1 Tax=uncultured Cetobacterium sp. TaxID=527638 RepID=UPI00260CD243|nr:hypothetical protein [uncultured Cetobacterium sp.]